MATEDIQAAEGMALVPGGDVPAGVPGDGSGDGAALEVEGSTLPGAVEATVECEFTTGIAGSGKTYAWRERIAADPTYALLMASTGIAAVNLGTVTVNSALGYFDTNSLRDSYLQGMLVRRLRGIREDYRRICIDEISMTDGDQLSLIVRAALEANSYTSKQPPLGIAVVGDFCQLPPVKARWAFESDEWHRFDANTTRLTKVWRQDAGAFLNALNLIRAGNGAAGADILTSSGVEWHSALDIHFDGTTIVPRNDQVSRYNAESLSRVPGAPFSLSSRRWGKQRSEWGLNTRSHEWGIAQSLTLKHGAYVTLLANRYNEDGDLEYCNGDCGWVEDHSLTSLYVRLARNNATVTVTPVIRDVAERQRPTGWTGPIGHGEWLPRAHWYSDKRRFVLGQVEYVPVRLGYASTVHRSQGLSLDRVQFDFRNDFARQPAMMYVSLSRCRTLEGLRLVGQPERFVRNVNIDPRVRAWL